MSITPYRNNKSVVYSLKRFRQREIFIITVNNFTERHTEELGGGVGGGVEHLHRNIGHQQTKMTGGRCTNSRVCF